jgi:hypothetical protein
MSEYNLSRAWVEPEILSTPTILSGDLPLRVSRRKRLLEHLK